MGISKKILALASAFCLCASVCAVPAFADNPDSDNDNASKENNYTYQVTLYPGDGTIGGSSDAVVIDECVYGSEINLYEYQKQAKPNDGKYYVKGIRQAGRDNSEAMAEPVFKVKGDAQYVIAYGLKKDQVAYTVDFVDVQGNQLAPSETLYGNIGDRPVVAFRYIDGYLPTAYNLTRTLTANESENTFTFTYNAAPDVVYGSVETVGAVAGATQTATGAAAAEGVAAVAEAAAAGEVLGEDGTPLAEPEQIESLDDNETPLASEASGSSEDGLFGLRIGLAGLGAAIVIALLVLAAYKSRKKSSSLM